MPSEASFIHPCFLDCLCAGWVCIFSFPHYLSRQQKLRSGTGHILHTWILAQSSAQPQPLENVWPTTCGTPQLPCRLGDSGRRGPHIFKWLRSRFNGINCFAGAKEAKTYGCSLAECHSMSDLEGRFSWWTLAANILYDT